MIEYNAAITATFMGYLVVMLGIGWVAYKQTSNSADYFLGGRNLGPWPAALSAGASDMSGWLLLGLPGYAFTAGFEALWLAAGLLLGAWLNWLICARRLRTYTITLDNALTIPEYLTRRFNDKTRLIQVISAFFILLFFLFYTSSGLVAGGKLFETVFGLDYELAVIVGTVCVVSYTLFGGFLAVSWTDLVQGLMMSAALLIVPISVLDGGGIEALMAGLADKNPELLTMFRDINGEALSWLTIVSLMAWGLGYFGQPHILARFKATRTNKDIKTARRIAVIWTALSMTGAMLVGLVGIMYVDANLGGELSDAETIFMVLVNGVFHPVIAGILLAAILAAIMSTADSQLLVSSSALTEDFYRLMKPSMTSTEGVLIGRFAVIAISVLALALAFNPDSTVLGLVSYAWAGFGAAFGPVILISLYWRRMNRQGALAGIIVGAGTVVGWKQLSGGIFDVYELLPGFVFAVIAVFVVSRLTAAPEQDIRRHYYKYEENLYDFE